MEGQVRKAESQDVTAIQSVQNQQSIANKSDEMENGCLVGLKDENTLLKYVRADEKRAFVYETSMGICGYALTSPGFTDVNSPGNIQEQILQETCANSMTQIRSLVHIAVTDERKGTRVADSLYEAVLSEDEAALVGEINESNTASQKFFRKKGWQPLPYTYQWSTNPGINWRLWYYER